MALIQLISLCVLLALTEAAVNPIREHPHSVVAMEGMWANFSCAIKLPGSIKWRIGDFTREGYIYNSAENVSEIQGLRAERSFAPDITGHVYTETIGILATIDMDRTPVECMFVHPNRANRNSFSKYALLNIHVRPADGEC